jgi:hypothetical protein
MKVGVVIINPTELRRTPVLEARGGGQRAAVA